MNVFLLLLIITAVLATVAAVLAMLSASTGTSTNPGVATGDTAPRPCCVENYCRTPHKDERHA